MAKLFSKEKDIFLKIINAILIIWVMVAIVITLGVGIHIVNREQILTYEEYKVSQCDLDKIPEEEVDSETTEQNCRANYLSDKHFQEQTDKENVNNFLIGLSNIIIVTIFMHLLNKKTK